LFDDNAVESDGVPEGVDLGGFFAKGCLSIGIEVLDREAEEVLGDSDEVFEATNALVLLAVSEHELEVRPFAMEMTKVLVAIVGWLHGMRS
jgi:hypothetical protein